MDPTQFSPILNRIYTKEDADAFVSSVDTFLSQLYTNSGSDTVTLIKKTLPPETLDTVQNALYAQKISPLDKERIHVFFTHLKEVMRKLKIFKLTLVFNPPYAFIQKLHVWIQENIGIDIILSIQKDPALIGGTVIEYGGIYRDYSLRKQLDEVFEKKRNEILKLIT